MVNWIDAEQIHLIPKDKDAGDGSSILVLVFHQSRAWGTAWYDFVLKKWKGADCNSKIIKFAVVNLP